MVDRFTAPLVHGKAGVITLADGRRTSFMGSVNETRQAWSEHYELAVGGSHGRGRRLDAGQFDYLWDKAVPMPEAVVTEIARCAERAL